MDAGMLEKGILGTIWAFCFGFGFIGETCEIRENPFSKQGENKILLCVQIYKSYQQQFINDILYQIEKMFNSSSYTISGSN